MEPLRVLALSVAGLAIGSFLNVCIHRLPADQSIVRPGSRCPACGRSLRWFENVPILSFVFLGGRCRTCRARISLVYPGVELLTALVFVLQYAYVGWQPLLAVRLVFSSAMIVLLFIDLRHRILPNVITLPGIGVGLGAALVFEPGLRSALAGVIVGGGGLFIVREAYYRLRRQEGLGMGDVKMLAMVGAFLGWQQTLVTLLLASLMGSVLGIAMLGLGLGDRHYALPLGSFLAVAAVATSTVGEPMVVWYGGLY